MSEMTRAEEQQAADATLDAQIAELMEARYGNLPDPPEDEAPDPDPPPLHPWYEDSSECVTFARWYWDGTLNAIGTAGEILDFFEKPWKFDPEYDDFLAQKVKLI